MTPGKPPTLTATVTNLFADTVRDLETVPEKLRRLAGEIEEGRFGPVTRGVLVFRGPGYSPSVHGLGVDNTHDRTMLDLQIGIHVVADYVVNKRGGDT